MAEYCMGKILESIVKFINADLGSIEQTNIFQIMYT